jgi:hypothetical protein
MKPISLSIHEIWPMLKFLQTDKPMDRPKTICPQSFDTGASTITDRPTLIKKKNHNISGLLKLYYRI